MNVSAPFIRRPVATTLIAAALFLLGALAYFFLPVASIPSVERPIISVSANRPGTDPATMAASVAAPLERRLAGISGVTELTSANSYGSTSITLQFGLDRNIDAAARDVQAAINAAMTDLPPDLPSPPSFRKASLAGPPVFALAMTSDTLPTSAIYDIADTVIAQRIAQIPGVADVRIAGAEQPAIRIQADPTRLASMGLSIDRVSEAIRKANVLGPLGALDGDARSLTFGANGLLSTPEEFRQIVVASSAGAVTKLGDVASVELGPRNRLSAGWYNGKPALFVVVSKQPSANVIETVDQIKALLPRLQNWIPSGVDISVLTDRTQTIRASVSEIQRALLISVILVMLVVFLFLRRAAPTFAAGITVPLSLASACVAIWAAGFTLDNFSLMALTIAVGFVVDDAIVMIENIERNIERGMGRLAAALEGARQIGFTVVSISLSLVAVFVPLLFMRDTVGMMLREFAFTLSFAIVASMLVSLTVTPMICAHLRSARPASPSVMDRIVGGALGAILRLYARTLRPVVDHPRVMLLVILATIGVTVWLYLTIPQGVMPQDDIGLINGTSEASPEISFSSMVELQRKAADVIGADPDVVGVGSVLGGGLGMLGNQGRFFIALKPAGQRKATSAEIVARLRPKLAEIDGLKLFMIPAQDFRAGGRQSKAQFQFTLWDASVEELGRWTPKVLQRLKALPQLADVSSDVQRGGLRANVMIDRNAASRMGVAISSINAALNSAFGQRQASIIYTERNQYRVIVEAPESRQRSLPDLESVYVTGTGGQIMPLAAVARIESGAMPLAVNHQGVSPAITLTFNTAPGYSLGAAAAAVREAVDNLRIPDGLHAEFAGDAADFIKTVKGTPLFVLGALIAVYIILGMLYESFIHPLTILSTLPSAGLGALVALEAFQTPFTTMALIGVLLLIGIVKKNGIMLVDFALQAEHEKGLSPHDAILAAAAERFRPILMTTLTAMLGALPLALATGVGAELRRPVGVTIVGGLLLSQIMTLYTTPVIYLVMSKLQRRAPRRNAEAPIGSEEAVGCSGGLQPRS
ncbi:efflux RND transporter permease subunit [Methylocystis sp. JR02]|uniref:efflux RND transporter permease subunit n=1 Tax=Methylocystis sp. JR02 TaxID=3046284 RepID=UPI0024BAFBF8|nr:efflux RND transporter permease subunit [Methylocystis sp. JR02]MDJ0450385.1 efflux RND transporter permease subunit [Methylocystis sp. JR02]